MKYEDDVRKLLWQFSSNEVICMTTKIEKKFPAKVFEEALNAGLIMETNENDIGQRRFLITELGKKYWD